MNPAPDRRALYWLFLAGSGAVGPLVPTLPLWLTAVIVVCAGWRYAIDLYAWPRPGWFLRLGLTVVLTVAVFLQFRTILGHHAGVALLVGLLGLKFLELRSLRDYFLSLFLFYLVLLGAYLQEQSLLLGIWSLVVVVASLAALIHVTQPQGLALGARLRLAGLLVLKALPLMLVVYLLFPRIQGTLWGLPTVTPSALTGLSEVMRPGSINDLSESTAPAFRVTFEGAMPPLRTLYWRGLVLTATDGRAWFRRAPELNEEVDAFQGLGDPVSYTVTLEPSNKPWLPALDLPAEVPPGSRYQYGYVLEHAAPVRERLTYSTSSHTRYRTPALKPEERELHLELPKTTSARVRALADSWQRENSSPLAVVQAALRHFRQENFVYTLKPPLLGQDPVDEFLFDTRRGFCEHYTAAFVTLMRAAGIPARAINGYLGGEVNAAGNYILVRQADAHAWAEVWTAESGWTRVDPTSAVAPERVELGSEALRRLAARGVAAGSLSTAAVLRAIELGGWEQAALYTRLYWDITNFYWYRWVSDYGQRRQERFLERLGLGKLPWGAMLGALLVGIALLLTAYALWQWRPTRTRDPVLTQYLRFCRKLARAGLPRAPHEGALDYARRCMAVRTDLKPAVENITASYLQLRYGQAANEDEWRAFRRAVAAFRA